jgi:hypothetical protein
MLNTDIVYLTGTNGHNEEWQPDCFSSTSPPAKVGRNREKDQLLVQMHFQNGGVDKYEHSSLIELVSQHYYGTAGSITAASRAAINVVNKQLLNRSRTGGFSPPLQAGLTCAVLRGGENPPVRLLLSNCLFTTLIAAREAAVIEPAVP